MRPRRAMGAGVTRFGLCPFRGSRRTARAAALIACALVASCDDAATVVARHRVDLILGTDSLTIDGRVREPIITRSRDAHWFVAGLKLGWKWAEFDSAGALLRAPGRKGGGPGEFTEIIRVIPLRGDTLLVIEPRRIVRALRDGSYIDEEPIPFEVGSHTIHDGLHWITASNSIGTLYVWALAPSGKIARRFEIQTSGSDAPDDGFYSGRLVSWANELWTWLYPQGPMLHLDSESGRIVERWQPFASQTHKEWRVDAVIEGPERTLLLHYFDFSADEAKHEWILIDRERSATRIPRPAEFRGSQLFSPAMAWVGVFGAPPLELLEGVAVYDIAEDATDWHGDVGILQRVPD